MFGWAIWGALPSKRMFSVGRNLQGPLSPTHPYHLTYSRIHAVLQAHPKSVLGIIESQKTLSWKRPPRTIESSSWPWPEQAQNPSVCHGSRMLVRSELGVCLPRTAVINVCFKLSPVTSSPSPHGSLELILEKPVKQLMFRPWLLGPCTFPAKGAESHFNGKLSCSVKLQKFICTKVIFF